MKIKYHSILLTLALASTAAAQSLYHQGSEAQTSSPWTITVGGAITADDNVAPGAFGGQEESSLGFNPFVGASMISITPQTTWNVYVRLGLVYLFEAPASVDEVTSQSRTGINFTHRFSERLRFSSNNFISYELEPDYSMGQAASRQLGEFFSWSTDNSIGYRWTDRIGSYSGIVLNGVDYDVPNNDRLTWEIYNQLRYQLTPQTVLTGDYRYGQTMGDGFASDSSNQFLLAGVEHRFSPRMIGIARVGAQFRDVDAGSSSTEPYLELALNSRITSQLNTRAFTRYGMESGDTVRNVGLNLVEFDERRTLRFGVNADYAYSPVITFLGGVDYIPAEFAGGRVVTGAGTAPSSLNENILNAYVGMTLQINDNLTGSLTYNFTDSDSDFDFQTFQRNRISVGLTTQF